MTADQTPGCHSEKTCFKCGEIKPPKDFHINPARHDGISVYCGRCQNEYGRNVYRDKRAANPKSVWADHAARGAKKRAARDGVPFALTRAMLEECAPTHCPVFDFPLDYSGRSGHRKQGAGPTSPTVDRIIPALGYVPSNVIIISMKANLIKQNATPQEIWEVATFFGNLHDTAEGRPHDHANR